ncbi:hypothetical protein ACH5RR_003205 [Cinchona calisaya]|uniref:Uncharacterized protein n=1 Tax=Cinchona calisaya TaxID=153742 RepID=A0ABD3AUA1_9GENT
MTLYIFAYFVENLDYHNLLIRDLPLYFQEGYVAKVQELASIKQKQDEDKTAARLHSFNGSCRNQCATSSQLKNEKMISLKSTSISAKVRSCNATEYVPVHFPEVILCLEVYHNRRTCLKVKYNPIMYLN